jgi:hypothetical protein
LFGVLVFEQILNSTKQPLEAHLPIGKSPIVDAQCPLASYILPMSNESANLIERIRGHLAEAAIELERLQQPTGLPPATGVDVKGWLGWSYRRGWFLARMRARGGRLSYSEMHELLRACGYKGQALAGFINGKLVESDGPEHFRLNELGNLGAHEFVAFFPTVPLRDQPALSSPGPA